MGSTVFSSAKGREGPGGLSVTGRLVSWRGTLSWLYPDGKLVCPGGSLRRHIRLQNPLCLWGTQRKAALLVSLGLWADGQAKQWGGPAYCLSFNALGGKLLANVYPLPQLTYNTVLAFVNKQSYAASASDSLVFSAQLLLLLFLINMPELSPNLLLCYLWFVNMIFAGRNHNHNIVPELCIPAQRYATK